MRIHKNKIKYYVLGAIGVLIITSGLVYALLRRVDAWFDAHTIKFNKIVKIELNKPIEIEDRQVEVKEIVRVINEIPHPDDLETDTERYIYEVFGIEDYKIAIAVAKSESGLREEAININTNSTIDVGVFQINQVHYKKEGCSLKDVSTMEGNVDCAYKIYQASGWNPWVVFQNGAFKNKLE